GAHPRGGSGFMGSRCPRSTSGAAGTRRRRKTAAASERIRRQGVADRQSSAMTGPPFFHVDVFAAGPLTGNGLTVFLQTADWSTSALLRVTQEMRQFESIFLSDISALGAAARVFTVEEELPFAGHPVLGAAAVLHRTQAPQSEVCTWTLRLPHGPV